LRDELIPIYEEEAVELIGSPWATRNEYIDVILNRSDELTNAFLQKKATKDLNEHEVSKVFRLLEMQRNTILMYTSCAPSNVFENGATSYKSVVIPTRLDLERVGMHYACASLFSPNPDKLSLFNYKVENKYFDRIIAGNYRLVIGRTTVTSKITHSRKAFSFAVLYLGQQNIIGNLSVKMPGALFREAREKLAEEFRATDLGKVIGLMQTYFPSEKFSIWHLFRDEKRQIFHEINEKSLAQIEKGFREIYNDNYQLIMGMKNSDIPIPDVYKSALKHVVNTDLHQFFDSTILNIKELKRLAKELLKWNLKITHPQSLKLAAGERIFYEIQKLEYLGVPESQVHIWKSQNYYYSLSKRFRNQELAFVSEAWKNAFLRLGELLNFRPSVFEKISAHSVKV